MKKAVNIIAVIFSLLLVIYSGFVIPLFPMNLGSYLPGAFGVYIIFLLIINRKKGGHFLVRTINALSVIWALSFVIMCGVIYINSHNVPDKGKDAVIVLGAGLRGDQVSITLALRLDCAVSYLNDNNDTIVVVSGGQGQDELIPEALAMKRYLLSEGIAEERIYMEDKSTSTYENFMYSKQLLDGLYTDDYEVIYITNDFHSLRAGLYAKKAGLDAEPISAYSPLYMLPSYYSREYFALLWYMFASVVGLL